MSTSKNFREYFMPIIQCQGNSRILVAEAVSACSGSGMMMWPNWHGSVDNISFFRFVADVVCG